MSQNNESFKAHPGCLITIDQVAGLLHLSPRTVRRYLQVGNFVSPVYLNGRTLRWREVDIVRWVESRCSQSDL